MEGTTEQANRNTSISKLRDSVYMGPFSEAGGQMFLIAYEKRNWKVVEVLYDVGQQLVEEGVSIKGIQEALCHKYPLLTTVQIAKMYQDFFVENGLVEGFESKTSALERQSKMLFFKIELISQQMLEKLKFLKHLFTRPFSTYAGIFGAVAASYALYHHQMVNQAFSSQTSYFCALLMGIVSTFIHEMGHVAASMRFGITPKSVGFAFYWAQPVFYTDVTETWRLCRRERFIIDIAGMCAQGLFILILLSVGMAMQNGTMMLAAVLGWFAILENLNPFLKMDGYWMMTDGIGVSNLHEEVYNRMRYWWLRVRGNKVANRYAGAKIRFFLDVYLVASTLYMVVLIKSMAFALPSLFKVWLERGQQVAVLIIKNEMSLGWAQKISPILLDWCTLTVMLVLLSTVCWKLIRIACHTVISGIKK